MSWLPLNRIVPLSSVIELVLAIEPGVISSVVPVSTEVAPLKSLVAVAQRYRRL